MMGTDVWASEATARTRRVIAGVDGSAASLRALDWAAWQAARLDARLEIHVASEPEYSLEDPEKAQRIVDETINQAVTRVRALEPNVSVRGFADSGDPAATLVEVSHGADLLVVGSRGRRGMARLLLGSVGEKCAVHAHCPVLIVRPSDPIVVHIRCPVTGAVVPTQLAMDRFTFERAALDDCCSVCPACGQHHRWSKEDALFEGGEARS